MVSQITTMRHWSKVLLKAVFIAFIQYFIYSRLKLTYFVLELEQLNCVFKTINRISGNFRDVPLSIK